MPNIVTSFDAHDFTLQAFIRQWGPSSFLIPDFQRRFVWETKQLTEFLDSVIRNDPGYYVGTIVVVRPSHRSFDIQIIDGQQRLTTLTFCIKVLYDILASQENQKIPPEIEEFKDLLLFNEGSPRLVFHDKYFKSHLSVLLKEANPLDIAELKQWIKEIQDKSDTSNALGGHLQARQELARYKAVTRLFNTYKDIQNYFLRLSRQELLEVFEKFTQLQLIEIICKDIQIVNSLFEGLNSKGVQLNNAELIKNKLFEKIDGLSVDSDTKSKLKESWDEMDLLFFTETDKRLIDKFLRHHWISRYGYISGPSLYDKYVELIGKLDTPDKVKNLIEELRLYADYYVGIRSTKLSHEVHGITMDKSVYAKFNDFGRLNNDQIYEILLTLLRLIKSDPHKQIFATKEIRTILSVLWAFCFRLQFIPVNTSKYERKFSDLCINLEKWHKENHPVGASALNFIEQELRAFVKDDEQFIENLKTQLGYKSSKQNTRLLEKIFYDIFTAYDSVKNFDRSYSYNVPTIEHILPQKPQAWGYKKLEIAEIVNNIGNLTLLDEYENNIADNKPFNFKVKNVYLKNKYKFNQDLSLSKEFGSNDLIILSKAIEKRSEEIAKLLNSVYRV